MRVVFKNHSEASCGNCGADIGDGYWYTRNNRFRGYGLYVTDCSKCGAEIFYDLAEDIGIKGAKAMRQYRTYEVDADAGYQIEGATINRLFQIAACLAAGDMMGLSGDERRDIGQWMQERLRSETQAFGA